MNNNSNFDLPPIRKIGPAVLPKPKNIKIHAGRGWFFKFFSLKNNSLKIK
jgi:hypothetical protein